MSLARYPGRGAAALAALLVALCLGQGTARALPDGRGWELVSPPEKNGGGIALPSESGPGTARVAAQGGAVAFASRASFANGAGASPYSQYIARRGANGWVTENITPAQLTGAYAGSPYVAFSADLGRALMRNPARSPECDPCPAGYEVRDNTTGQVVAELSDPSEFEPSTPGVTFFVDAGHLYREAGGVATDLTPLGGVDALLGADANGQTAYYRVAQALWRWRAGAGSTQILTAFGTGALADTSPITSGATADGQRFFFTTAAKLVGPDVNFAPDAYQWQAQGKGSCTKAGGCVDLISAGLAGSSTFFGASASGGEAFFLTDRSLLAADSGAVDLYVAKVGGGFPEPTEPPLCLGDACQSVPPAPSDPVLTTVLSGPGNPEERYRAYPSAKRKRCPHGRRPLKVRVKGGKRVTRCVKFKEQGTAKRHGAAKRRGRR